MQCHNPSQPVDEQGPSLPAVWLVPGESWDLAQQYLDIAGVIFLVLDPQGNITLLNRKGHEVLEYPEGSLLGKNWIETCLPERERARVAPIFHQLVAGKMRASEHVENAVLTRSGRERIIAWHNTLLRDKAGERIGTLSSGEDITDRKRAEEALRQSEQRFRSVVETSPDAIVLSGLDGRVLIANQQAALLGGFKSVDDLLAHGTNGFDFLAPEDIQRAASDICELVKTSIVRNAQYDVVRTDGRRRPAEINVALLKDAEGTPTSMICAVRDITDRKQAEKALAAALREWSVSFDAMADGVSVHGSDHTILNANQSLCQMLGKTKEEVIGSKCYRVFHGTNAPPASCPLERSRQTLQKEETELFEPTLNKWLAASTSPVVDDTGCLARLVHVVRDVTERKEFEFKLARAKDQAEAANRAKTEFLTNISHEIRTPMTAILGFTDLLASPDLSPEEQRDYVETVARNGKSLLRLINEILDLSKIEAGKMTIECVDCPVRQLVDDVMASVRVRAREKGLSLEVDYAGMARPTIHTDPARLRQILLNLLGNAVKFTERGGVRMSVRSLEPQGLAQVQFAISDTGIGIAPEKLGELFQPFTQADNSTTRRFGGTGLGLAISKRLAKVLGGDIEVTSELERGSTFTLTIASVKSPFPPGEG